MNKNQILELRVELRDLFNFWETCENDIVIMAYLEKKFPAAAKYVLEYYNDEYAILDQEKLAEVCLTFDQDNDLTENYN